LESCCAHPREGTVAVFSCLQSNQGQAMASPAPSPAPIPLPRTRGPAALCSSACSRAPCHPLLSVCCSCLREGGTEDGQTPHILLSLPSQPLSVTRGIGKNKQLHKVHRFHAVPSVLIKSHCHFYLLKILPSQFACSARVVTI